MKVRCEPTPHFIPLWFFLIGWYPSLRKIFFMGEFQRIWGVSSPTHILLATQDVPLFSVLKLSINSRSHTVFFQKATRLEAVRAGLVQCTYSSGGNSTLNLWIISVLSYPVLLIWMAIKYPSKPCNPNIWLSCTLSLFVGAQLTIKIFLYIPPHCFTSAKNDLSHS